MPTSQDTVFIKGVLSLGEGYNIAFVHCPACNVLLPNSHELPELLKAQHTIVVGVKLVKGHGNLGSFLVGQA